MYEPSSAKDTVTLVVVLVGWSLGVAAASIKFLFTISRIVAIREIIDVAHLITVCLGWTF